MIIHPDICQDSARSVDAIAAESALEAHTAIPSFQITPAGRQTHREVTRTEISQHIARSIRLCGGSIVKQINTAGQNNRPVGRHSRHHPSQLTHTGRMGVEGSRHMSVMCRSKERRILCSHCRIISDH